MNEPTTTSILAALHATTTRDDAARLAEQMAVAPWLYVAALCVVGVAVVVWCVRGSK